VTERHRLSPVPHPRQPETGTVARLCRRTQPAGLTRPTGVGQVDLRAWGVQVMAIRALVAVQQVGQHLQGGAELVVAVLRASDDLGVGTE
jgi:hypothetical protein